MTGNFIVHVRHRCRIRQSARRIHHTAGKAREASVLLKRQYVTMEIAEGLDKMSCSFKGSKKEEREDSGLIMGYGSMDTRVSVTENHYYLTTVS